MEVEVVSPLPLRGIGLDTTDKREMGLSPVMDPTREAELIGSIYSLSLKRCPLRRENRGIDITPRGYLVRGDPFDVWLIVRGSMVKRL